jgi:hypothetical protein
MELGNSLFGHSRGKYPLSRGKGFEEVLDRIFEVCAPNNRMYGETFENEVFAIFPYYWGDCTCRNEKNHKADCLIVKPNFLYKPMGFAIRWYKYPLRDSYTNQKITLAGFKKIISACIQSCKEHSADMAESRVAPYIKDWNWDADSHEFALQMGAFLLQFIDHLRSSGLSQGTIRKHESNCWLIGSFECDYGDHDAFTPAIFLDGPGFIYEFERKVSDSRYAIDSYESTWRKIEKYVRASL